MITLGELAYLTIRLPSNFEEVWRYYKEYDSLSDDERKTLGEKMDRSLDDIAAMENISLKFDEIDKYCIQKRTDSQTRKALLLLESWTHHNYYEIDKACCLYEIPDSKTPKFQEWDSIAHKLREDISFRGRITTLYKDCLSEIDS